MLVEFVCIVNIFKYYLNIKQLKQMY